MTNLPLIPKDRNWSPETWRAGLDEAVRRSTVGTDWAHFAPRYGKPIHTFVIAHATTLLDAGIVKPVVSEAEEVWKKAYMEYIFADIQGNKHDEAAIAVIQSALDKARSGE